MKSPQRVTKRLADVAEVVTGSTPSTSCPEYYGGEIPFVGPSDLGNTGPILTAPKTLTPVGAKQARVLPEGAVLVCCIGATIGKVGIAGRPLATNQQINALAFDERVIWPRYGFYFCMTLEPTIRGLGTSTTLPILPKSRFQELLISFPPLDEQRRIADILDKADAIRRKRKQAIALTDQLLRSTFMSTVGPLAAAYDHWPIKSLRDLAADTQHSMRTGPFGSDLKHSEFVESGVCVLGIDNAVQNRFAWGERRFISFDKYRQLNRYTVNPGDVIVTIMGTVGRSAVIPNDIPLSITSKHLATITLNREIADPHFISQAFVTHPELLSQISESNRGAIMNGLNLGLIKEIQIKLPPLGKQLEFSSLTRQIRQLEAKLRAGLIESENLFSGLSFAAFGGKLNRTEQVAGQLSMFNK